MPFLIFHCFSETLRFFPVLALHDRMCTLPAGSDGYSLEPYHKLKLQNGTPVFIPVHAIHMDPEVILSLLQIFNTLLQLFPF